MKETKYIFVCFADNVVDSWSHLTPIFARAHHPGGRLNKKDGLTRYGNSHVKDKTS